jgi:hypothetical protein
MNRKIVFFMLFAFVDISLFCKITSAQFYSYNEYYSANILSSESAGRGNTGVATSGDAGLIYLNPATLNVNLKYQFNAGYNLKSESLLRFTQNPYSFSIAGAYRINKSIQTGFAYQNDYSYDFNFYPGMFEYSSSFVNHSFRVPLVYNYKWLRLGTNINITYNYISYSNLGTGSFWRVIPEFGTVITPISELSFGLSYVPAFTSKVNYNITNNNIFTPNSYAKYPNRFKFGTEIRTSEYFKLNFDYYYDHTQDVNFKYDRQDFHLGFEHLFDENWTFRYGLYSNQKSYDRQIYFLTLGSTFKKYGYSFNLAGQLSVDDYNGKSEYYVLNFGLGYEF